MTGSVSRSRRYQLAASNSRWSCTPSKYLSGQMSGARHESAFGLCKGQASQRTAEISRRAGEIRWSSCLSPNI